MICCKLGFWSIELERSDLPLEKNDNTKTLLVCLCLLNIDIVHHWLLMFDWLDVVYWRRVTRLKPIACLCLFFNVYIMHPWVLMFDRLDMINRWCNHLKKQFFHGAFLWRSLKHLGSQTLIHLSNKGDSESISFGKGFHEGVIGGVMLTWSW